MIGWLVKLVSGGALSRVLETVDRKISAETDRDKIKGDILREHVRTRSGWMRAGGFVTLLIAGGPFIYHAAAVAVYSVHWCADCHAPKDWTVAALPPPFDQYQAAAIMAFMGCVSVLAWVRK